MSQVLQGRCRVGTNLLPVQIKTSSGRWIFQVAVVAVLPRTRKHTCGRLAGALRLHRCYSADTWRRLDSPSFTMIEIACACVSTSVCEYCMGGWLGNIYETNVLRSLRRQATTRSRAPLYNLGRCHGCAIRVLSMAPANAWDALCHSKTMQRHGDGFLRALPARLGGARPVGQFSETGRNRRCLVRESR